MPKKNTSSQPRILVVLATLGERTELLRQTLTSIAEQDAPNVDIVMIYPFSSKPTNKLAAEFKAKKLADPGGMSAAVNLGIKSAGKEYKYVTWIGDDDLLAPGSLSASIAALENNPDGVASFGYCDYINENGKLLFTNKGGWLAPWLMTWGPNLVPLPGAVFRLSTLQGLDYIFDESLRYTMDLDLFLRLRKIGKLVNTGRTVSSFRWHSTSATVSNRSKSSNEAQMVKRRHLSKVVRPFAILWEKPIKIAAQMAANRVNETAKK